MNYTLITGASKGIGAALAVQCAKEGMHLILVGRSDGLLEDIAKELRSSYRVEVITVELDLLEPYAVKKLYNFCVDNQYKIRVLVNNAGYGAWGAFESIPLDEQLNMIRLNQTVMVELCYRFLPMLAEMPYAHILNMASTAAYQPVPYFSVYAATKTFVVSFSRSLRIELKKKKINVSCVCPGPTESEFWERAGFKKFGTTGFKMKADEVAETAVKGMISKKALIVPGFSNRIGTYFSKHMPAGWAARVIAGYFKPTQIST